MEASEFLNEAHKIVLNQSEESPKYGAFVALSQMIINVKTFTLKLWEAIAMHMKDFKTFIRPVLFVTMLEP